MLFYYMIIVVFLFILQFSISCVCLGVDEEREIRLAKQAWHKVDSSPYKVIHDVENVFQCCGLDDADPRRNNNDSFWEDERILCQQLSLAWEQQCNVTTTKPKPVPTTAVPVTTAPPITSPTTIPTTANPATTAPPTAATTENTPPTIKAPAAFNISYNVQENDLITGCPTCTEKLESKIGYAFNMAGGLGLFFAFTEFVAVVVAYIYCTQCNNVTIIT